MTLHARIAWLVSALVTVAVLISAAILMWTSRQALLQEALDEAEIIARLLARSAAFAAEVPGEVEGAIGDQMVVEATAIAHLVAIAEKAGMPPDAISSHLGEVVNHSVLDEVWVTDAKGHAYLRTNRNTDFTFSPDPAVQPQAHVFYPLLTGDKQVVIQDARVREVDNHIFKYAAVAGIDQPRIVQVGYRAEFFNSLKEQVGLKRFVGDLIADQSVLAIHVLGAGGSTLAFSAVPGLDVASEFDSERRDVIKTAIASGQTVSRISGNVLQVVVPMAERLGGTISAITVFLPAQHVNETLLRDLRFTLLIAVVVVLIGLLASVVLARYVSRSVEQVSAAAQAVEEGRYQPGGLDRVSVHNDEVGRLARVFEGMARQVAAREQRLKSLLVEHRIVIDEAEAAREAAAITSTDHFRRLRGEADKLRQRMRERQRGA